MERRRTFPHLLGLMALVLGTGPTVAADPCSGRPITVTFPHAPGREVAGQIDMIVDHTTTSMTSIMAVKLVPALTVGHERSKALPDVRSATEVGLPRPKHNSWSGFLVPGSRDPDAVATFSKRGIEPMPGKPQEFAALVSSERVKWARLVRETGVKNE